MELDLLASLFLSYCGLMCLFQLQLQVWPDFQIAILNVVPHWNERLAWHFTSKSREVFQPRLIEPSSQEKMVDRKCKFKASNSNI